MAKVRERERREKGKKRRSCACVCVYMSVCDLTSAIENNTKKRTEEKGEVRQVPFFIATSERTVPQYGSCNAKSSKRIRYSNN